MEQRNSFSSLAEQSRAHSSLLTTLEKCQETPLEIRGIIDDNTFDASLQDLPDGVYVSSQAERRKGVRLQHFELLPETMQLGAGNSHHEVTFGEAVVTSEGRDQSQRVGVALKGFGASSNAAYRELSSTYKVQERGLQTFKPLALAKIDDKALYISQTKDYITGFDSFDWTQRPSNPGYEQSMMPVLERCADAMTDLAVNGIYHGDMVPKNIVVDEQNEFVFFDFEDTEVLDDKADIPEWILGFGDVNHSLALKDLVHFWKYTTSPMETSSPFLIDESAEVVYDEFVEHLLKPYMRMLREKLAISHGASVAENFDYESFINSATTQVATFLGVQIAA